MHAAATEPDEGDEEYREYSRAPRFRAYKEEVAAVIQSFDRAREWADLIKCLQRLMKVLEAYTQFPRAVPSKLLLAKRLSQCLNPSLPSGVHLKTLEVYAQIFSRLGKEKLAIELPIYSYGLLPLFQYASTQVKPAIMDIVRSHYLPLGHALRPCLPGLVLSLLPGMDEDTSEFYQPVLTLIDDLRKAVNDDRAFFHSLWKNMITSPSARIPAINYLSVRLPAIDISSNDEMLPERNSLVLTALINTLSDSSIMILRVAFDLLLQHFPLHHAIFGPRETAMLMRGVLLVLTRREMSLNRRVFSWVLGPGDTESVRNNYFNTHAKAPLVQALQSLFAEESGDSHAALRPYKIATSLIHKDEVGNAIVEDLLEFVILNLHRHSKPHPYYTEVSRAAKSVFDEILSESIFTFLATYIERHCGSDIGSEVSIEIVSEAMSILHVEADEARGQLQVLIFALLRAAKRSILSGIDTDTGLVRLVQVLRFTTRILCMIPPLDVVSAQINPAVYEEVNDSIATLIDMFQTLSDLYFDATPVTVEPAPLPLGAWEYLCRILSLLRERIGFGDQPNWSISIPRLVSDRVPVTDLPQAIHILVSCSGFNLLTAASCISIKAVLDWLDAVRQLDILRSSACSAASHRLLELFAHTLWHMAATEACNEEVGYDIVRLLLRIQKHHAHSLFTLIGEDLAHPSLNVRVSAIHRYSSLSRLAEEVGTEVLGGTRCLHLMLDNLPLDRPSCLRLPCHAWLLGSSQQVLRVVEALLSDLMSPGTARRGRRYETNFDGGRIIYGFSMLREVVAAAPHTVLTHMASHPLPATLSGLLQSQTIPSRQPPPSPAPKKRRPPAGGSADEDVEALGVPVNHLHAIILCALRIIQAEVPAIAASEQHETNRKIRSSAAEFLGWLFDQMNPRQGLEWTLDIQDKVLQLLARTIGPVDADPQLQVHLLSILRAIIAIQGQSTSHTQSHLATSHGAEHEAAHHDRPRVWSQPSFISTLASGLTQAWLPAIDATIRAKNLSLWDESWFVGHYWIEMLRVCMLYLKSGELSKMLVPTLSALAALLKLIPSNNVHEPLPFQTASTLLQSIQALLQCSILPFSADASGPATVQASTGQWTSLRALAEFVRDVVFHAQDSAGLALFIDGETRNAVLGLLPELARAFYHLCAFPIGSEERESLTEVKRSRQAQLGQVVIHIWEPLLRHYPQHALAALLSIGPLCPFVPTLVASPTSASMSISLSQPVVSFSSIETLPIRVAPPSDEHELERLHGWLMKILLRITGPSMAVLLSGLEPLLGPASSSEILATAMASNRQEPTMSSSSSSVRLVSSVVTREWTVIETVRMFVRTVRGQASLFMEGTPFMASFMSRALDHYQHPGSVLLLLTCLGEYVTNIKDDANAEALKRKELHAVVGRLVDTISSLIDAAAKDYQQRHISRSPQSASFDVIGAPQAEPHELGGIEEMLWCVRDILLPTVDLIFEDKERAATTLTPLINIILPLSRLRGETVGVIVGGAMNVMAAASEYPYLGRLWRRDVMDQFANDPHFFNIAPGATPSAARIVFHLINQEKTVWTDLLRSLSRSLSPQTAVPSLSLWGNREGEMQARARHLQRLCLGIWCGLIDQHVPSLPALLERAAEALRLLTLEGGGAGDEQPQLLYRPVFLMLRLFLLRFSAPRIRSFWPVILTELIRIWYGQGRRDHRLQAETCKFLDFATLIFPEDFPLYRWIFFTDGPPPMDAEGHAQPPPASSSSSSSSSVSSSTRSTSPRGGRPPTYHEFVAFLARSSTITTTTTSSSHRDTTRGVDDKSTAAFLSPVALLPEPPARRPLLARWPGDVAAMDEREFAEMLAWFDKAAYQQLVAGGRVDEASVARSIEADLVSAGGGGEAHTASSRGSASSAALEAGWVDVDSSSFLPP